MDAIFIPVYDRYLEEARLVDGENKKILKIDCNNEYHGHPKSECFCFPKNAVAPLLKGKVTCIEINRDLVNRTKRLYPDLDIQVGDVRKMDFPDNTFDSLIDLSVLDHMTFLDGYKAIAEYGRVLKKNGDLVLVIWCTESKKEWIDGAMVYHYLPDNVERELKKYFQIAFRESLMKHMGDLILWRCKKNG